MRLIEHMTTLKQVRNANTHNNIRYFNKGYHPHLQYLVDYNQFQISMPNGQLISKTVTEGKEMSYIKHWQKRYGHHTVDISTLFRFECVELTRGGGNYR